MAVVDKGLTAGVVRVAPWSAYRWLRHGFSTRQGGVSTIYGADSLNLTFTKDDDPARVTENRRRLLQALEVQDAMELVTLKQVHSALVRPVREEDGAREGRLRTTDGKAVLEGDGAITNLPGIMLGIQTADCVPVLVADVSRRAVAAFHAGWRGTVGRIVEHGILQMQQEYGSRPEDLIAAVGPSIGSCCYAVGEELRSEFHSHFSYADKLFRTTEDKQIYLDLWEANRRQLLDAGVPPQRITVVEECTACSTVGGERKYFSHRAEQGFTGRMMSMIGVVAEG
jgi:YfiH family protein